MKYIVTIKKENEPGIECPAHGGIVYEISTSQLETKWREQGLSTEATLVDLLNEAAEVADAGLEHWQ